MQKLDHRSHVIVNRLIWAVRPQPANHTAVADAVIDLAAAVDDVEKLDQLAQAIELGHAAADRNHALLNERFGQVSRG